MFTAGADVLAVTRVKGSGFYLKDRIGAFLICLSAQQRVQ